MEILMICELVSKAKLTANIYDFTVLSPEMAAKAVPGQFVHVLCEGGTYLRRPISIADIIDKKYIRFIFEVRGKGTAALAESKVGDELDVLGPLGNGFILSDAEPADESDDGEIVLVGGGIGIFPLLGLAKSLNGRASVLLGFRNADAVIMTDEFEPVTKNVFISTDDGSMGYHGFITDILKNIVESNKVKAIFTCGPKPMMKIVSEIARENDILCQVSMEERMGCGVGACVTCTCTVKGGERRRVCKDGPIFYGEEVEWDG